MQKILKNFSLYTFYFLLAYMPFHVFLATWAGSSFDIMTVAKIAKDVLMVLGLVSLIATTKKKDLRTLFKDRLFWLIGAYGFLTIILALFRPTEQDAEVLGAVYNLRFFAFFTYAWLISLNFEQKQVLKKSLKIVMLAGLVVAVFGLVQYFLLPNNALSHLGYTRANGTPPAFFIDEKPDLERVMSTVKDPNSLGAYLLIIVALSGALMIKAKSGLRKKYATLTAISLICLWVTFSRGALLGLIVVTVSLVLLGPQSTGQIKKYRKPIGAIAAALLSIVVVLFVSFKNSYFVKNTVFHADNSTVLEDPNQLRVRFFKESIKKIIHDPVGSGPGTAGIVSIRNQTQGTVLNENYYLQIAEEVGWLGLVLFLVILIYVAARLYDLRGLPIARALLASLIGISFVGLLIHVWSNEAVAYTWWGLSGLAYNGNKKL